MRITFPGLIADAWRMWRADWDVLTAVAGAFVFLPALGVAMLVPDAPPVPQGSNGAAVTDAMLNAYRQDLSVWLGQYAIWWFGAAAVMFYGQFAIVALYLSGDRPHVGRALEVAGRRVVLLFAAGLIVGLPVAVAIALGFMLPVLLIAALVVWIWVAARTLAMGPVVLAERAGPIDAIQRSLELTRGSTFALAAAIMTVLLASDLAGGPFRLLDQWMVTHAPNPIARAIVDAIVAAITALGATFMALLQVAAYRRLRTR